MDYILETFNLTKDYGNITALNEFSFKVQRGTIHGICGENGAGKSTFIKLISGAIKPTTGEMKFEGVSYKELSPSLSISLGIAVIYQEFSLIPYLSVSENIFFGREVTNKGVLRKKEMYEKTKELLGEFEIDIEPDYIVSNLGVAQKQIVEILKAVSSNAKFIIMDEPTTPLTLKETDIFYSIVDKLKQRGVTIIFITHRLEEVFRICDFVTVLTDGNHTITKSRDALTEKSLISYMVGRDLNEFYPTAKITKSNETTLEVINVTNKNVHNISFKLKKGEILGLAGLVGSGRTELANILYGIDKIDSGNIKLNGVNFAPKNPGNTIKNGVVLIPEDRKNQGLILDQSVQNNIVLSSLRQISSANIINKREKSNLAKKFVELIDIKVSSINQLVGNLSGGNQQKVVFAKVMARESEIMIFDEPTRGIDIGAKQEIYNLINDFRNEGKAIIMISSEMPELIGMADRIAVMHEGTINGFLNKDKFSQETILWMASGRRGEKAIYE